MITPQNIRTAKNEILRLKRLKKVFKEDPEAQKDLNKLMKKHYNFVQNGQQKMQDQKIKL